MVKTARAMLLMVGVLAVFAGCNLGTSIFPDRLMGYEAFTDISGYIDADRVWNYNFQIIRNTDSGTEYLVLANDNDSFDGVHVAIFNTDLKVLGKFTLDQLDAMDTGNPFHGSGAMVDANGDIVVGNRRFTATARKATYASTPSMTLYGLGLALPEADEPNYVNIWTENASNVSFKYSTFTPDWSTSHDWDPDFLLGLYQTGIYNLWVRDTDVAAIIGVSGQPTKIHLLNRAFFASNLLCTPIHDCFPAFPVPPLSDPWWNTLGYTDSGFAMFYGDVLRKYVLFDTNGIQIDQSDEVSGEDWPNDQLQVYGRTAGWYIFNRKEMTLERRPWWWL
jgi:hypothetical protein